VWGSIWKKMKIQLKSTSRSPIKWKTCILDKLRNILRMYYQDYIKYSKLLTKILFERADAVVEKSARNALANIKKKRCIFKWKSAKLWTGKVKQFTNAMENIRQHCEYTVAYFFENSYINFGMSNCSLCSYIRDQYSLS
jgi:hypothetical protein